MNGFIVVNKIKKVASGILLASIVFAAVFYNANFSIKAATTYTISVFDGSGSLKTTINAEAGQNISIKIQRYYTPSIGNIREICGATSTPKLSDAKISCIGDYAYCSFTMPQKDVTIHFKYEADPAPVILDMDFSSDVDDVMALRMATQADAEGYIDLVGVCLSTTSGGKIVEAVEGVLDYDGYSDIPIGTSVGNHEGNAGYYEELARFKENDHLIMTATELYQMVLSETEEKVNIITTGYLTNIQKLLLTEETRTLFIDNVDTIYVQGGHTEGIGDNNLGQTDSAISATNALLYECSLDNINAVFIPYDFAQNYVCGSILQKNFGTTDPVGIALCSWHDEWPDATPSYGRTGWDPTTVWIASLMMNDIDQDLFKSYPLYINQNNDGTAEFLNTDKYTDYTPNAVSVERISDDDLSYVVPIDSALTKRLLSEEYLLRLYSEPDILQEHMTGIGY